MNYNKPFIENKITDFIPSVFDIDIGKDPDDTCVALIVGLNPKKYNPALIITNDESQTQGRARFLTEIIKRAGANIPVAAGLPSTLRREDTLVERAGLIPREGGDFIQEGVAYLKDIFSSHKRVNYFGLGALTNLATVLKENPEFAKKVNLIQMGPAFQGIYRKKSPQYNVKLDIPSFKEVLSQVHKPKFLMSHVSWGAYGEKGSRHHIGIYVHDPVWNALKNNSNPALNLFAEHLKVWNESGKPCSIMHDPLTVLSFYDNLVDYVDGEIIFDQKGFVDLTEKSKLGIRKLNQDRLVKLETYLKMRTPKREGLVKEVEFSLNTNYDLARHSIINALFGSNNTELSNNWKYYNSIRKE